MSIENKREVTLLDRQQIATRVEEMGQLLGQHYQGKKLFVVSLLKGSFIFTADLVREIPLPVKIDFMITSSYGHSETSTGILMVTKDIDETLEGYDVLVVDDITDSGITMKNVVEHLKKKNPNTIKSCVLLDKPSRRQVEYVPDYIGFEVEDKFIVGYGLNYGDYYRNVPYVFAFED
jgi:hypoxanthine phosphoribosyltransferase